MLVDPPGPVGWLVPRDHKRLALLCLAVGGALALRAEMICSDADVMGVETYSFVFTLRGALRGRWRWSCL